MSDASGAMWAFGEAVVDVWRLVVALLGRGWLLAAVVGCVGLLFVGALWAARTIARELDAQDNNR